jgi:RHS repeat-associated protein
VSSEDRGYQYDTAWNLNRLTNNGTLLVFQVDVKNQLTNAYSAANIFDGNGNMTSGTNGHQAFVYDDENRLVQWFSYLFSSNNLAGGDHQTVFAYDGLGRLRKRLEYVYNSGGAKAPGGAEAPLEEGESMGMLAGASWQLDSETDYIYDGRRVIQERNGSNTPTVSYTRGSDLSGSLEGAGGIGGLLARSSGYSSGNWTSHAYYHADGNGNITCLINSSQSVVASYRYDPFGNTLSQSGSLASANVYRFSSKEIHVNSGMYYYLYRFYVPGLHRWLNWDPMGESGGINLYGYVYNSPLNYVDPDGEQAVALPLTLTTPTSPNPINLAFCAGAAVGTGLCLAFPDTMTKPGEWIGNLICPMSSPHGKGERNWQHESDNPWKGWRVDPKDPTKIRGKDQNGKDIVKPRPPGFPDPNPQPPKPNPPKPPEGGK